LVCNGGSRFKIAGREIIVVVGCIVLTANQSSLLLLLLLPSPVFLAVHGHADAQAQDQHDEEEDQEEGEPVTHEPGVVGDRLDSDLID
jgi:hypothetical protein